MATPISGKDIVAWNIIIRAAVRKVGSYIYCLPVFSQARRVLLNSKLNDGTSFMDFLPKDLIAGFNQQEMKITLINGSIITMVGSNSADSIVGSNALGIVISEAALADPMGIAYLRPIISASNGFFIAISTPRSHNHFWELYNVAKRSDDWYVSYLTVEDTQHIPIERIEADVRDGIMSKELARQEYFCSWSSQEGGAYYSKYVDKMRLDDRLTAVPHEPSLPTYCFCDLGINDSFVLIWVQFAGPVIRIIDYYENNSEGLEHYVNIIKNKPYGHTKLYVPHDAKVRELQTGVSRIEKLKSLNMEVGLVAKLPINDGIEAVRSLLPKTWIDMTKCSQLIKAIENYTKEYDERNKVYRNRPNHNRWSNANDALRYLAVSYKKIAGYGRSSPEDLNERYQRAMYGTNGEPQLYRKWNG